jgi:hypothetical protein
MALEAPETQAGCAFDVDEDREFEEVVDRAESGAAIDDAAGEDESAQYVAGVAQSMGARSSADDGFVTHLMRTPAGHLVPMPPLTEAIGIGTRPFHRNRYSEPAPRWVGVFLAACVAVFVPYIIQLGLTSPSRVSSHNYGVAWVGLDVMELVALALTGFFAWTRSTWVAMAATGAAALLVCDAWFDVVTAHDSNDRMLAVAEAIVLELPMALFCLWIGRHAEVVADRATRLLLRRSSRQAALLRDITAELGQP